MQLDSHGNPIKDNTLPEGFVVNKQTGLLNRIHVVERIGRFKYTKTQRKEMRKQMKAYFPLGHKRQGELKPNAQDDVMLKGYNFIMTVLGRGCSVSVA